MQILTLHISFNTLLNRERNGLKRSGKHMSDQISFYVLNIYSFYFTKQNVWIAKTEL